jgi:hypothetical protein
MLYSISRRCAAAKTARSTIYACCCGAQQLRSLAILPTAEPTPLEEPLAQEGEFAGCRRSFLSPIRVSARGNDILHDPLFNKGTSFKSGERDRLRIRGLVPFKTTNIGAYTYSNIVYS